MMSNTKMKRPATPAQMAALTRANEARAKLQDAPYQRNRKKMEMALKWTHAWGATTSKILCQVVGVKQQDFITGMVKSKVLRIVKVLNKTFYLCTAHGRSVLVSSLPENDPLRHVQLTRTPLAWGFEHSEKAQELLAKKISEYGDLVEAWASEKELRFLMAKNKKIPDCAIYLRDGRVIFYEIEITKKYNQELDSMIFNLICLAAEEIQITCEIHLRKSLFNHYQGALREIKETGLYWYWSKDVLTFSKVKSVIPA